MKSLAGLFKAIGYRTTAKPPLGKKGFALGQHLGLGLGVHHVREVGLDLLVQVLGRVGQEVALLVHDPNAIDALRFSVSLPFAWRAIARLRRLPAR